MHPDPAPAPLPPAAGYLRGLRLVVDVWVTVSKPPDPELEDQADELELAPRWFRREYAWSAAADLARVGAIVGPAWTGAVDSGLELGARFLERAADAIRP